VSYSTKRIEAPRPKKANHGQEIRIGHKTTRDNPRTLSVSSRPRRWIKNRATTSRPAVSTSRLKKSGAMVSYFTAKRIRGSNAVYSKTSMTYLRAGFPLFIQPQGFVPAQGVRSGSPGISIFNRKKREIPQNWRHRNSDGSFLRDFAPFAVNQLGWIRARGLVLPLTSLTALALSAHE
jgi:hypothetical protein